MTVHEDKRAAILFESVLRTRLKYQFITTALQNNRGIVCMNFIFQNQTKLTRKYGTELLQKPMYLYDLRFGVYKRPTNT